MNGEGSGENTPELGGNQFGGGGEETREQERSAENGRRGNKRIKATTPIDWSGELPDSLLIHILSFLNVKEAAITSVLSKRWEFLWADLPRLEFRPQFLEVDPPGDIAAVEKVRNFVSWVNRTLAVRRVNYLEKFDVSFIYHKCFSSDVDAWVQFAVESKVKTLNFRVLGGDDIYTMPQVIYSCPSLTKLHVHGCYMVSKRTIEWQSLTDLHLQVVLVDQHLLDEILSSCPVLYSLYIEVCRGFNSLEVNSRSLHVLSIVDSERKDAPSLKISAPYLHSLNISQTLSGRKLELGNISSLVRVAIDCYNFSWDSLSEEVMSVMSGARELLESVKHVKELYVGLDFIKVVSTIAVTGRPLPQSRRDLLMVKSGSKYEMSFPGIMALLESSPNLETFVLEGCAAQGDGDVLDDLDDDLADDLLHLKTIQVRNFADSTGEPMLTLARILLERATNLEEMTIKIEGKDLSEFAEMVQAMLTYPRSSTKAVVHLVK